MRKNLMREGGKKTFRKKNNIEHISDQTKNFWPIFKKGNEGDVKNKQEWNIAE